MTCLRCKWSTNSRGIYCEAGSYWNLYFCDKLTELDIDRLHNDHRFIYVCKTCAILNKNTNLKIPVSLQPSGSKSPKSLLVMPDISTFVTGDGSAAADILDEECGSECHVCHTSIEESPTNVITASLKATIVVWYTPVTVVRYA